MLTTTKTLPEHVKLSQHLREDAPFFIEVMQFGITYYIAATQRVRLLFELDADGKTVLRDRRRKWDEFEKDKALRDIVGAIHLQMRDVVLADIEQGVTRTLLSRMTEVMHPTVRGMIEAEATKALPE